MLGFMLHYLITCIFKMHLFCQFIFSVRCLWMALELNTLLIPLEMSLKIVCKSFKFRFSKCFESEVAKLEVRGIKEGLWLFQGEEEGAENNEYTRKGLTVTS